MSETLATVLRRVSFALMVSALAVGAFIIIGAMVRGHRDHELAREDAEPEED
jgi:hypothetical protein